MPLFNIQKLKDQKGLGLIQIFFIIAIMLIVMTMSGLFDPPKSEVTDLREGVILENPTSQKNTLNIIEIPIGIPTVPPTPTRAPTIALPTPTQGSQVIPPPTRTPSPTPSGPTSTPKPTNTPRPPLPTPIPTEEPIG